MFEDQVIDQFSIAHKYNISVDVTGEVSTLTIESVVQADAGHYTCGVVNKLGEAQATVQLAVKRNFKSDFDLHK